MLWSFGASRNPAHFFGPFNPIRVLGEQGEVILVAIPLIFSGLSTCDVTYVDTPCAPVSQSRSFFRAFQLISKLRARSDARWSQSRSFFRAFQPRKKRWSGHWGMVAIPLIFSGLSTQKEEVVGSLGNGRNPAHFFGPFNRTFSETLVNQGYYF